ncbi:Signal peptidase complex subunit 1 [Galemys pyrenaicus]|uniref:Signal peptidase complex subunit 1 n=1 Tax=Galemys pyrenaicus TaxID=202257 RepID=A0A8J6AVA6_GALPY|nr:Signal peptidase complex subunit 1 [Galemys pyrenaicus]
MARGGAWSRLGRHQTSASGTAAIALTESADPLGCTQERIPAPTVPELQPLSPCCPQPALCHPPSQPVMLEHLSSLPTQMDYKGQKLAEQMFQGIILFSAVSIGFAQSPPSPPPTASFLA